MRDNYLERIYEDAQELKEKYGAEAAYDFLMSAIYYRLHGKLRSEEDES